MRFQRKSKTNAITETDIATAMRAHGAEFKFTAGGCLVVANLAGCPEPLRQMFFDCDQRLFVAAVKCLPTEGEPLAVAA